VCVYVCVSVFCVCINGGVCYHDKMRERWMILFMLPRRCVGGRICACMCDLCVCGGGWVCFS